MYPSPVVRRKCSTVDPDLNYLGHDWTSGLHGLQSRSRGVTTRLTNYTNAQSKIQTYRLVSIRRLKMGPTNSPSPPHLVHMQPMVYRLHAPLHTMHCDMLCSHHIARHCATPTRFSKQINIGERFVLLQLLQLCCQIYSNIMCMLQRQLLNSKQSCLFNLFASIEFL